MQNEKQDLDYPPTEVDWTQVTPYDVIRHQNCKTARFLNKETYPSIRPPVSMCSNVQTMEWLADAVEENGCARPFGSEQNDDVLEVWKQSPNKHTLAFYGILSDIPNPEAVKFNATMSKCLNKVNGIEDEKKQKGMKGLESPKKAKKPKGPYVLNRGELKSMIDKMPTIQRKLNSKNALSWLHCPEPEDPEFPFTNDGQTIPLNSALDMEKPVRKPKQGLRRKHPYCEMQCGLPGNKCTELEWMKYKNDPIPYEVAFALEMSETTGEPDPEPRNYDELYTHLVGCFQKSSDKTAADKTYAKCCGGPRNVK
ncbi:uncharacterized protein LOC117565908 [Drosophila albomicans]|uniref:Uncharacterized protein LOC117565908 n=1 Tax=Drosophila albomicans TaxID=7291 RepID=A0A9C6ST27_DROAB|nr:uncharacterized protein LOC117565908 [Drosophila albomicans]